MSNHTAVPWEAKQSKSSVAIYGPTVRGCHAEIARMCGFNREADAEFIVRAVNAHDDLLAACEATVAAYASGQLYDKCPLGLLKAAIAKATGETH